MGVMKGDTRSLDYASWGCNEGDWGMPSKDENRPPWVPSPKVIPEP